MEKDTRNIIIDKDMGIRLLTSYKPISDDRLTKLVINKNCGKWTFSAKEGESWKWNKENLEKERLTVIYGLIKLAKNKYKWN